MKKWLSAAPLLISLLATPLVWAGTVNINKADVAALDALDGIGAKKAEAIIAWRTQHGEFKSVEDLKQVPGIGEKLFEKLKTNVTLTDSTDTVAKPSTETTASVPATSAPAPTDAAKAAEAPKPEVKADAAVTAAAADAKVPAAAEVKAPEGDKSNTSNSVQNTTSTPLEKNSIPSNVKADKS